MKLTKISINETDYPEILRPYLKAAEIYDSSCSSAAKVIFIDLENGYFLKSAKKGTLCREAEMTKVFASFGLCGEVVHYESDELDFLMTEKVFGDDCTAEKYLSEPKKLAETTALVLSELHSKKTDFSLLPNRTAEILRNVSHNYKNGSFDNHFLHGKTNITNADEAWKTVKEYAPYLKSDTLIHGDYCLPNIILNDFKFSGLIDLGAAGIGDRHFDIFWGIWTLYYNLKTDAYAERFIDAYGKDMIDFDMLRAIAAFECLN